MNYQIVASNCSYRILRQVPYGRLWWKRLVWVSLCHPPESRDDAPQPVIYDNVAQARAVVTMLQTMESVWVPLS